MSSYSCVSHNSLDDDRFYLYKDGVYSEVLEPGWFKKSYANQTQDYSSHITLTEAENFVESVQTEKLSNYGAIVTNPINLESYKNEGYKILCAEVTGDNISFGYIKNFEGYSNSDKYTTLLFLVRRDGNFFYGGTAQDTTDKPTTDKRILSIPLDWSGATLPFTGGRIGFYVVGAHRIRLTKIWLEK